MQSIVSFIFRLRYIYFAICLIFVHQLGTIHRTDAILNVASPIHRHSNELAQFERYESLIGNKTFFESYISKWQSCIDSTSINVKRQGCKDSTYSELVQMLTKDNAFSSHPLVSKFPREPDPVNAGYYLPDCKYSLDFSLSTANMFSFFDEYHSNYFVFKIRSHSCKQQPGYKPPGDMDNYRGGASFDIHVSNIFHLVSCEVRDNFDDSYDVLCLLSKTLNRHQNSHLAQQTRMNPEHRGFKIHNHHSHQDAPSQSNYNQSDVCSCFAISVILDYEHFDAFSEYFQRPPLNHIVMDDNHACLCLNGSLIHSKTSDVSNDALPLMSDRTNSEQSSSERRTYASSWVRRISEPRADGSIGGDLFSGRSKLDSRDHSENCKHEKWGSFDYAWTGPGNTFPLRDEFKAFFANKNLSSSIIGESHFRYTWDFFYYLYYGGSSMVNFARKHGSVSNGNGMPGYTQMLFATDAADYIRSQPCAKTSDDLSRILAVQSGAWDMTIAPLRNALRNSNSFQHLVNEIKAWSSNNCSTDLGKNRLIYVSTQPYPRCPEGDLGCEKSRGYRNNYAIAALDHWMLKSLLASKSDIVFFVDAMKIMQPKMRFMQITCSNHFLCHESDNVMHFSTSGVALAGEILNCMMNRYARSTMPIQQQMSNNININVNCMSLKDLESNQKVKHAIDAKHQAHATIQFSHIAEGSNHYYYKIEGNVMRQINDRYTYELLRNSTHYDQNNNNIMPIIDLDSDNLKFLDNYPVLSSTFLIPSREAGKQYKPDIPYSLLPGYSIDSLGLRAKSSLPLNSSLFIPIRTEDLLDIQLSQSCSYVV